MADEEKKVVDGQAQAGGAYAQAEQDVRKMREAAPEGAATVAGSELAHVMETLGAARYWGGSPPMHVRYYGVNVVCGFMTPDRYVQEFPGAVAEVMADWAKFQEAESARKAAAGAARLAESKAVRFIAGLDDAQLDKLGKLLQPEQAAEIVAEPPAETIQKAEGVSAQAA